ncbi:MAG TPA: aldo/keto reductase [Polyangiaceae bacterium]|nr:aldo/keto reductase [Polyangiaceae bacterium]
MNAFGSTGIEVSRLGLGAGGLGDVGLSENEAERLLLGAVDRGVTFVDAARSYGAAEERIGRFLGPRRDEVVLSTKGGYGVDGVADWTGDAVRLGVEGALRRMRTDCIDVFHLHSCPVDVLARGDVVEALLAARRAGKIRVAAYSGENAALSHAVESGAFGSVQCSVNVFDQRAIEGAIAAAARREMGVVGKRPLGNCAWRFAERPSGQYAEEYWLRMRAMAFDPSPLDWGELALRFAAFTPGVCTVVVGTTRLEHLDANVRALERGPLDDDLRARVRAAFVAHDDGWIGQI